MFSTRIFFLLVVAVGIVGCATPSGVATRTQSKETTDQQLDAARKVVGGMANRDMSREELLKFGQGLQHDPQAGDAVNKIVGNGQAPVVKYSPVTGKHYSGDVDIDPETGVKLLVVPADK